MRRLSQREEGVLRVLEAQLEHAGKLRKIGVKVRQSPLINDVNREAGRLAKYCTSPNRRLCNEALRLILSRYNPIDVEGLLRQLKSANYPPEVGVAYLTGAVLVILGRGRVSGVTLRSDYSIDPSPVLTGQFTLDQARQVTPLNEPRSGGWFKL